MRGDVASEDTHEFLKCPCSAGDDLNSTIRFDGAVWLIVTPPLGSIV